MRLGQRRFHEISLTPLLEKHVGNFVWGKSQEPGIVHIGGGGTAGGSVYSGFDKTRRRGVVVLTASGSGRRGREMSQYQRQI